MKAHKEFYIIGCILVKILVFMIEIPKLYECRGAGRFTFNVVNVTKRRKIIEAARNAQL